MPAASRSTASKPINARDADAIGAASRAGAPANPRIVDETTPAIGAVDRGVALLEVQTHRPRAQRRAPVGDVIALHRRDGWIVELPHEDPHPRGLHDHVLIDLTNDREARRADAAVDGGGGAAALA